MRRWMRTAGLVLIAAPVVGLMVSASGLIPITATSGHWPVTEWFLRYSKRRSVATHTIGLDLPSLSERWRVIKGAGHYESGCSPCHGSPVNESPRIASSMLPRPPLLATRIPRRTPEYLFYLVKNGIKLSGMPAWPAQGRDDEVMAVVAFLQRLPHLDADAYEALAGTGPTPAVALGKLTPAPSGSSRVETCARCHGAYGLGRGAGAFPRLAGQSELYLRNALTAFAKGGRPSGIMGPVASTLSSAEIDMFASWYSGLPEATPAASISGDNEAPGAAIATRGIPEQGVPPCRACHGPSDEPRQAAYPSLIGQYAEYLTLQLELFSNGLRGGTPWSHVMQSIAERLTPAQMQVVAAWYASLGNAPLPGR